ncbi:MAG: PAS domain S-box protein [Bacteroidota bacterium]
MLEQFKNKGDGTTEDLLKSILDSAFNGIMAFNAIRDENGKIIDFEWIFTNDVAERIVGLSTDKLHGARLLEIMPGNKDTGLFAKYVKVVETGNFKAFEQYYPGEKINKWFKISAVKLRDGFTVTFQDITDLKEAMLDLQIKEKKYQQLFDESIDAIFLVDRDFTFVEVNPSLEQLSGFRKDELIYMKIEQLFTHQDSYRYFRKLLLDSGQIEEFETKLTHQTGSTKFCLINSVALTRSKTEEKAFIGVIRDITKRKQAEKELIIAEKLLMTGKIARTIAHEVRNPLTNITLALEQLKDEIPKEIEDAELYFNIIQRNTDRVSKLITDLLNSSKPKELELKETPLDQIIKNTLKLIEDRLRLQNMQLEERYIESLPTVLIDQDQLKIALLNLFINAIEAMKPELRSLNHRNETF